MNFDWKINLGHILTIAAILGGWLLTQGAIGARNEATEKTIAQHGAAIEKLLLKQDSVLDEVHQLSKTMVRLQTQSEDRQDREYARRKADQ